MLVVCNSGWSRKMLMMSVNAMRTKALGKYQTDHVPSLNINSKEMFF